MGETFIITGNIIHGNRIGRRLDFPTANIVISPDAPVDNGVYAANVTVDGIRHHAMVNIGTRPTLGDNCERFAEAHIFNFDSDIYGKTINIELLCFIRSERKFNSLEELKTQIEQDRSDILNFFR